ncbi:MAG: OpgC family protein [Terriglobales bacterium]
MATSSAILSMGALSRQQKGPNTGRLPELDALRGVMLVGMTLTHLPTGASHYANQLFGFVSWAEGFVLLSALLSGRVYGALLRQRSWGAVFKRLWRRGAKLYGYHLVLLAVAFTLVAAVAVHTQEPALQGLLDFYLAHRVLAIISSALLLYCPPLLDILPMYIVFLFVTPFILGIGRRWGWKFVLAPSALIWLAAQFGARGLVYDFLVQHAGLRIPFQNLGAFDLYAWQLLWVFGLWLGAGGSTQLMRWFSSRWTIGFSVLLAAVFLVMRYQLIPYFVAHPVDQGGGWVLFDKWQLGVLRLLDFAALGVLFTALRPYLGRKIEWAPLVLLGKSSLEVFCTSLLICFAALSLVGDGARASVPYQAAIVMVSLAMLYAVAYLRGRPKSQYWPVRSVLALQSNPAVPAIAGAGGAVPRNSRASRALWRA